MKLEENKMGAAVMEREDAIEISKKCDQTLTY